MEAMKIKHPMMVGMLLIGFGGVFLNGACGGDTTCPAPTVVPPVEEPATDCAMPADKSCMRYRIQLDGDVMDPVVRAKYIAWFGSACYVSEANTFDCFYKDPQKACADGVLVPEVLGASAHNKSYPCLQVAGTDNYWRQVGSDPAIKIDITYEVAPRETPLIDVNGVSTAVNGPYRNLTEPDKLAPGNDFHCAKIDNIEQWERILQVNRKAHGGAIHSDLAGFTYPCGVDENCKPKTCTEPLVLKDPKTTPNQYDPERAEVHHEVRRKDKRGCFWGTNSNGNAAVISVKLNRHLTNNYPMAAEVLQVNSASPYMP